MDLDDVRRKRIKLFDPRSTTIDEASSTPGMNSPSVADDERYARELQATFEQGEHLLNNGINASTTSASPDTANMEEDEKLARELQNAFERSERVLEQLAHDDPAALPIQGAQTPVSPGQQAFVPGAHPPGIVPPGMPGIHMVAHGVPLPPGVPGMPMTASQIALPPHLLAQQQYLRQQQNGAGGDGRSALDHERGNMRKMQSGEDEKLARQLQAQYDDFSGDDDLYNTTPTRRSKKKRAPRMSVLTKGEMAAQALDNSPDAVAVRELAASIISVKCGICDCLHTLDQEQLLSTFKSSVAESPGEAINFFVECGACGGKSCYGCGSAVTAASVLFGNTALNGSHPTWHCDRGRLATLWFTLCGFDAQTTQNKLQQARNAASNQDTLKRQSRYSRWKGKKLTAKGTGYGGDYEDGFDYSFEEENSVIEDFEGAKTPITSIDYFPASGGKSLGPERRRRRSTSHLRTDLEDELTSQTMVVVAAMLPNAKEQLVPTEFDMAPPANLGCLLQRSSILDKAAELLHNGSIDDVGRRACLYNALLGFIRALYTAGTVTLPTLFEARPINKAGHNVAKVSFGLPTRIKDEPADESTPLLKGLESLVIQSNALISTVQANEKGFSAEEDQETLILCMNITDCMKLVLSDAPGQAWIAQDLNEQVHKQETKVAWQKYLNVGPVADDIILRNHYYANDARELLKVINPPQRRLAHIYKEIVTLQNSLPPGIFVRYGDSRPDIMKVLIVGPEATPYENGLFEFDLICGIDYPNVAPKMLYKTTGGGRVSFNPNLYADGKVCLSLLGTWEGEAWRPGKSTLLQVFVSIQAMIFCDEPWCNEPGRERDRGSERSKAHNRFLYPKVVKYGMIEWLEGKRSLTLYTVSSGYGGRRLGDAHDEVAGNADSTKEIDIWADVAKKHFEVNGEDVIKTVCDWTSVALLKQLHKKKPKKGLLGQGGFLGTGWGGRTLGDGENTPAVPAITPFRPSDLDGFPTLLGKLGRLAEELEKGTQSMSNWYDEYFDDEDEEDEVTED